MSVQGPKPDLASQFQVSERPPVGAIILVHKRPTRDPTPHLHICFRGYLGRDI